MNKILEEKFTGPLAWRADTPLPNDGFSVLNAKCQDEIAAVARELRDNPLPIEALRPGDFDMQACNALMAGVRDTVDSGTGLTVIGRLDVAGMGEEISTKIYWLLMSMMGRPVAQKWRGTLIYDVQDTGARMAPGSVVRSSKTNSGTGFHNDNSCNLPPDFVALLCLQTAKQGGISGIVSFESVYNQMLDEHREVLPRLYEPFFFDRVKEHAPGDEILSVKPIFEIDGRHLHVNFSPGLVELGYLRRGEEMDREGRVAFDALCKTTDAEVFCKAFEFQRGQIQVLNNRRLGHRRTAFRDWDDSARKRHLVRLWIRDSGRPFYQG